MGLRYLFLRSADPFREDTAELLAVAIPFFYTGYGDTSGDSS